MRRPCALLLLLLPLLAAALPSLQTSLEGARATAQLPADLLVRYEAMHPLYGGVIVEIHGDGRGLRTQRGRAGRLSRSEAQLSTEQLQDLVGLLVQHQAWEQRVSERQALPDEGRARLIIQVGDTEGGCWEWFNDLAETDRLVHIAERMKALVPP